MPDKIRTKFEDIEYLSDCLDRCASCSTLAIIERNIEFIIKCKNKNCFNEVQRENLLEAMIQWNLKQRQIKKMM
jgi:hypothetical protein